jgi:hypothetical protein
MTDISTPSCRRVKSTNNGAKSARRIREYFKKATFKFSGLPPEVPWAS